MLLNPPEWVSVDLGDTLVAARGKTLGKQLVQASPLRRRRVEDIVRRRLHSAVTLTPETLAEVSDQLRIKPHLLEDYQSPNVELMPAARSLLQRLRDLRVPVVLASNCSELDHSHVEFARRELGEFFAGIYVSYKMGAAKPERQFFERIAAEQGVHVSRLVHVGDRELEDVRGALAAGACALRVNSHPAPSLPAGPDRYRNAVNLQAAVDILPAWLSGDPDTGAGPYVRPTLAARAEVLITNHRGEILCIRDPNDNWWTLPGGRQEAFGEDPPSICAAREIFEELGLHVILPKRPDATCWARAEASDLTNKTISMYQWRWEPGQRITPNPREIDEYDWFDRDHAAQILHPRAAERVWHFQRGIPYFEQH